MADKPKEKNKNDGWSLKYLSGLFKELGLPGFLAVILTFIFLAFSSRSQKQEFIDRWLLMKNVEDSPFPFSFIVLGLLLLLIMTWIFCKKTSSESKKEIKRLSNEKSRLQEILLNRVLESSN